MNERLGEETCKDILFKRPSCWSPEADEECVRVPGGMDGWSVYIALVHERTVGMVHKIVVL